MYQRIILPTDGSELAMEGVNEGLKLASKLDIPVTAIHVIEIGDIGISSETKKELEKSAKGILRGVKDAAEEEVKIETKVFKGTPYKKISEYAEEEDAIFISSHGSSGFRDLFMGSTTQRLLKNADCTVAVVRGKPGED